MTTRPRRPASRVSSAPRKWWCPSSTRVSSSRAPRQSSSRDRGASSPALSAAVDVGGANIETVAGAKSIKCTNYGLTVKGAFAETYASQKVESGTDTIDTASSKSSYRSGAGFDIKAGDVVFTAQTKIQIKAGGVTVKITPGSVTISGKFKSSQSAVDDSNESYD